MTLGEEILMYRAMNNMTQDEFAKMVGISKLTILQIEKGYRTPRPTTEIKIRMAMNK